MLKPVFYPGNTGHHPSQAAIACLLAQPFLKMHHHPSLLENGSDRFALVSTTLFMAFPVLVGSLLRALLERHYFG